LSPRPCGPDPPHRHGTAFDIAGKGIAREASLVVAAERAAALSMGWGEVWRAAQADA
jgi:4-hydroxythreonine-4-phosphate dehydrogenase